MATNDQTALFNQYENEYCNKSTDISRKISTISTLSGELRRRKIQEVESDIREADDVIKRMDMEARSLPADRAKQLLVKVKEYKADISSLREQLKQAAASGNMGDAARAELGLGGDYYTTSAAQRDKMLSATQRLENQTQMLNHGKGLLTEAEETGVSILKDLHGQRETILRSKDTLQGADDNISKARKILSNMTKRMMQNKVIMFGIIMFLLFGIGLIIYFKVK